MKQKSGNAQLEPLRGPRTFLLLVFVAFLIAGCISARRGERLAGPLKADAAVERGRAAFMQFCNRCHPDGDAGIGPALNNKPLPGFMIKTQVRIGLGAMPRFPSRVISGAQLDDIVKYIKAQRRRGSE